MKLNFTNFSRRNFLERIAIASTILVASPSMVFSQKSSQILRFAVLGEDSVLAGIIDKSDKMTFVDDHTFADVIYVSKAYQKSLNSIQDVLTFGKQLIVADSENNDSWVEYCRKSGNLLTIVERSSETSKLFENANYYEGKVADIQKVITIITFFEQHTKPLKFKIIVQQKPVKMLIG
jgi:hypothetical protein